MLFHKKSEKSRFFVKLKFMHVSEILENRLQNRLIIRREENSKIKLTELTLRSPGSQVLVAEDCKCVRRPL